jgi:hypothetical protein
MSVTTALHLLEENKLIYSHRELVTARGRIWVWLLSSGLARPIKKRPVLSGPFEFD